MKDTAIDVLYVYKVSQKTWAFREDILVLAGQMTAKISSLNFIVYGGIAQPCHVGTFSAVFCKL